MTKRKKIQDLENEVVELKKNAKFWKERYDNSERQLSIVDRGSDKLTNRIHELERERDNLKKDRDRLQAKRDELTKRNGDLGRANRAFLTEIERLDDLQTMYELAIEPSERRELLDAWNSGPKIRRGLSC